MGIGGLICGIPHFAFWTWKAKGLAAPSLIHCRTASTRTDLGLSSSISASRGSQRGHRPYIEINRLTGETL